MARTKELRLRSTSGSRDRSQPSKGPALQSTEQLVVPCSLRSVKILLCVVISLLSLCNAPAARATSTQTSDDVITVSSPANGNTVSSTFTVTASSTPSVSGATIEGMIVWLDGVEYGPIIQGRTLFSICSSGFSSSTQSSSEFKPSLLRCSERKRLESRHLVGTLVDHSTSDE